MAQQSRAPHKAQKQQDPYVQRGKTLTSAVQRLRGWVGSDPSREPELADALVELTAHRLQGHGYSAAAPDAQEAGRYAAQLLTANGPIGPYTSTGDATRYVTAVVHLAAIQVGLGLPDAAGRMMASLREMEEQLADAGLALRLDPSTAVWALSVGARCALAAGDAASANAYVDAALARSIESGRLEDPEWIFLAVDVERVTSDARWAAGRREQALGYLLSAKARYDAFVGDRLREPGRVGPAVLERLAEPLTGLYGDTADLLSACGESALGLAVRLTLIETLQGLAGRVESAREDLAVVLAAQAGGHARVPLGPPTGSWEPLSLLATYASATAHAATSRPDLTVVEAERLRAAAAWMDGHRAEAEREEAERAEASRTDAAKQAAARRAAEREAAERAEAERAAAVETARLEAERSAAAEEAERLERKRRREERLEAHRLELEQREAERLAAERRAIERREAERRAADPTEAERLELERLQQELAELERADKEKEKEKVEAARVEAERVQAERLDLERREAERLEAERLEVERLEVERREAERQEAERVEAERQAAERQEAERQEAERQEAERQEAERQEAERQEAERQEAERLEAERREIERRESEHDELRDALQTWENSKAQGDRRAARAANERVVELLRPRAEADLARFGPQLMTALEELSRARLRGGDIFGSRGPAREAKELAKSLAR